MGKFIISKRSNGHFQFILKADNGQVLLSSQGYTLLTACENGVDAVKRNCSIMRRYELKTSGNRQHFFNLKAANGQIVATSEVYTNLVSRDNGVAAVMRIGIMAPVEYNLEYKFKQP